MLQQNNENREICKLSKESHKVTILFSALT